MAQGAAIGIIVGVVIGKGPCVGPAEAEQQPIGHSMVEEGCKTVTTLSEQIPNSVACDMLSFSYTGRF